MRTSMRPSGAAAKTESNNTASTGWASSSSVMAVGLDHCAAGVALATTDKASLSRLTFEVSIAAVRSRSSAALSLSSDSMRCWLVASTRPAVPAADSTQVMMTINTILNLIVETQRRSEEGAICTVEQCLHGIRVRAARQRGMQMGVCASSPDRKRRTDAVLPARRGPCPLCSRPLQAAALGWPDETADLPAGGPKETCP